MKQKEAKCEHVSQTRAHRNALLSRIFSVGLFVVLVGGWMFVLWPSDGGLGILLLFEGWAGLILAALSCAAATFLFVKLPQENNLRRLIPVLAGLCLTFVAAGTAGLLLCENVAGTTCIGPQASNFGDPLISFLMLIGGCLIFSNVLAPVDASGCDC